MKMSSEKDPRQVVRHLEGEKVGVSSCRTDRKKCVKKKEGKFKYQSKSEIRQVASKPYAPPVQHTTQINT